MIEISATRVGMFKMGMTEPNAVLSGDLHGLKTPEKVLAGIEAAIPDFIAELSQNPAKGEDLMKTAKEAKEALLAEIAAQTALPADAEAMRRILLPAMVRAATCGAADTAVQIALKRQPLLLETPILPEGTPEESPHVTDTREGLNMIAGISPSEFLKNTTKSKDKASEELTEIKTEILGIHEAWSTLLQQREGAPPDQITFSYGDTHITAKREPNDYQEAYAKMTGGAYIIATAAAVIPHLPDTVTPPLS